MTTTRTCTWTGGSGVGYDYYIHPINGTFPNDSGNYILAKETAVGWIALYIGQTNDLRRRMFELARHERSTCAIRRGMTHIHVHVNPDETTRRREERDLIERYRPACNRNYVSR